MRGSNASQDVNTALALLANSARWQRDGTMQSLRLQWFPELVSYWA